MPESGEKVRKLKSQADNQKAEAETLKEAARLEDLFVWVMERVKPTKKGNRSYHDWIATCREREGAERASWELWEDG